MPAATALLLVAGCLLTLGCPQRPFDLTILHTNDVLP
jgi:hypothetical protein